MTFRGISSISGGAFGGVSGNGRTANTSANNNNTTADGPFTLPRKGYGAGSQRPTGTVGSLFRGIPEGQSHASTLASTSGAALTMSGMTFTPRPPMQPPTSAITSATTSGSLSQRIMSASAARPTTSGSNTVAVPGGQAQNPRAFGLDLASLLANLDASAANRSAPQQSGANYGSTPTVPISSGVSQQSLVVNTATDAQRKLFAAVPQVPAGPRIPSAGRTIPATVIPAHASLQSMPKPTAVEESVTHQDEPAAHSPSERVEIPKMETLPQGSSSEAAGCAPTERQTPTTPREALVVPPDGSKGKMTPAEALGFYDRFLSRYERREILEYDEVYFVGMAAKKVDAPVQDGLNFGYDDERGDYVVTKGDHIAFRYEVISELGKGSFGQVLKVHDHKKNTKCALKIIRNKKRFHQQATVEIRILDHLRSRDPEDRSCTVRMLNYFKFRSHTIVTFEMHSMNLYELAKLNKYQPFAPALIKRFTAQILVAMSFMWREQIVHCDLKPENILLRYENKTSIKIIDFGSSCFESERIYTYIQSRFYRAPEIILGLPYGRPIDLWSLGCIVCEMQMGYPIFPGESEKEQLLCVMEVLGVPPSRLVDRSPRKKDFFDSNGSPRLFPNSRNKIRKPGTKELMKALRTDDASFVDFILCFFQWEPAERMTPNEAMRHPWIAECFQQDTVQVQPSTGTPRPRLNSARPSHHHASSSGTSASSQVHGSQAYPPSSGNSGAPNALPSIDLTVMQNGAKGINAWRLTNRKIGSAQTSRTINQLTN